MLKLNMARRSQKMQNLMNCVIANKLLTPRQTNIIQSMIDKNESGSVSVLH